MLSVQRILSTTQQYSSSCIRHKTITPHALGGCNKLVSRDYGQRVPEKFLIDEEDIERYKIDPRVRALSKKIIYSDYLEAKTLRFGREKNSELINKLRYKAKVKRKKDLLEIPATSVALKYLRESRNGPGEIVETEDKLEKKNFLDRKKLLENENISEQSEAKPIHMPYSSTDRYEKVVNSESKDNVEISELNQEYMRLYEKYLETKKSDLPDNLENIMGNDIPSTRNSEEKKSSEVTKTVPPNWMTDYEQYDDFCQEKSSKSNYGTPDPSVPVSSIPCGGCGALLHCQDPALPGYLPSELFVNQKNEVLSSSICQRCHFIKHYDTMLDVTVSPDEYPALLSHIKKRKAAIVLMIDLTDFPCSIWSGIMNIIGKYTQVFVVGNKVDLLPNDGPNFLKNVEQSLLTTLNEMGMSKANIKAINLISSKTGYGIEQLINKLHKYWEYKGDVYLIGCTNVGKSSLFNALLGSDYCKIQAVDLIQRATVSPWPGTTLNLLKFPILSPTRWRLWMRTQRLIAEREGLAELSEFRTDKFKETKRLEYATPQGHIGKTFASSMRIEGEGYFGHINPDVVNESGLMGLNENEKIYKNSRWCYDTPGAMLPDQILHFLTTEELLLTLPRYMITPRSFVLYKGQSLFLAGLGRLDFLTGCYSIICTVFASRELPVTICNSANADRVYKKLLKTEALVVPINDPERLKLFPALESKSFEINGIGMEKSAADVVLSSAGWIAVTIQETYNAEIQAWTPQGRGIHLRTPAMLSRSVNLRGYRIPDSQAYTKGKRVYSPN